MAHFAGSAHWTEPSPLFAHRARSTPLKCKNEYPVLPLREETAAQAVVGYIVWAFRRLKKPRCREISVHSVYPNFSFFPFFDELIKCVHLVLTSVMDFRYLLLISGSIVTKFVTMIPYSGLARSVCSRFVSASFPEEIQAAIQSEATDSRR